MKNMYGQIEGQIVKAYLSFQGCSKLPTIHYGGDSAVLNHILNILYERGLTCGAAFSGGLHISSLCYGLQTLV